jgi:hypothetical protein
VVGRRGRRWYREPTKLDEGSFVSRSNYCYGFSCFMSERRYQVYLLSHSDLVDTFPK